MRCFSVCFPHQMMQGGSGREVITHTETEEKEGQMERKGEREAGGGR